MIPKVKITKINKILKILKSKNSIEPFNDLICNFLDELSLEIKKKENSYKYPELITLSFFCRKANLVLMKKKFVSNSYRIGRGLVFHITPTNIPINFAYSLIFSLLAGNNNIVRLPSKNYKQVNIIYDCLTELSKKKKFAKIKNNFFLIKYDKDDEITKLISSNIDARIIWGGDQTIQHIKNIPTPEKSLDVAFPDRYSFCIVNCNKLKFYSKEELKKLAYRFYNDTYLVDQNACSSPHLIIWIGEYKKSKIDFFWNELSNLVESKYKLVEASAFEKYNLLMKNLVDRNDLKINKIYHNYLYRIKIKKVDRNITKSRGKFGIFFEYNTSNINNISKIISNKIQTITYSGFKKNELLEFLKKNKLSGIDRVVPIGTALDIGLVWDGFNLIDTLSREIEVR